MYLGLVILCLLSISCLYFPPLLIPSCCLKICSIPPAVASAVVGYRRLFDNDELGPNCWNNQLETIEIDGETVTWT